MIENRSADRGISSSKIVIALAKGTPEDDIRSPFMGSGGYCGSAI